MLSFAESANKAGYPGVTFEIWKGERAKEAIDAFYVETLGRQEKESLSIPISVEMEVGRAWEEELVGEHELGELTKAICTITGLAESLISCTAQKLGGEEVDGDGKEQREAVKKKEEPTEEHAMKQSAKETEKEAVNEDAEQTVETEKVDAQTPTWSHEVKDSYLPS